MINNKPLIRKLTLLALFSIAFAYVESSVVVYLRQIYYPEGFKFPIKRHYDYILILEIIREFATLIIFTVLSVSVSRRFWEGFGYFLLTFGLWDIFFYVWLKITVNWPASILDWDILFLLPIPWLGPVLAPITISLTMVIIGLLTINLFEKGHLVKPSFIHWILVLIGSAFILFSFMYDIDASFYEKYPKPYLYGFLILGEILYITSYVLLYNKTVKNKKI